MCLHLIPDLVKRNVFKRAIFFQKDIIQTKALFWTLEHSIRR